MQEFFAQHSLYIVLAVVLVVWAGIFGYLYSIDKRISKLEGRP